MREHGERVQRMLDAHDLAPHHPLRLECARVAAAHRELLRTLGPDVFE